MTGAPVPNRPVVLVAQQLVRPVPGGIGTYIRSLLRALDTLDRESLVPIELFASRELNEVLEREQLGANQSLRASRFGPRAASIAWDLGLERSPAHAGLVHALSLAMPPGRAPLVVTVHDLAFQVVPEAFSKRARRWHERALRRAARRAARIVVPSEEVRDDLLAASVGIGANRIRVIPEGADHLPPADDDSAAIVLERAGVTGPFVLVVGTLEPRKNLPRVIEAFARLSVGALAGYRLVVCGPPGWGREVEAVPGVVSVGHVPDRVLASLYQRARVVVYAPLHEGFGLPAVEAMAQGAVVVSSPVPSSPTGSLLVDPLDVDSIACGIQEAALDDVRRSALARSAIERASELTWERAARAHLELWREVMS